jgi:F-box protein 9
MSTKKEVTKQEEDGAAADAALPMDRAEEIWLREDERWELTWPIWHMLPRHERKALAFKYGYKTIGEFEEYMSLQRGITDSAEAQPYANNLLYPEYPDATQGKHTEEKPHALAVAPEDDEESADENLEEAIRSEQEAAVERITTEELMKVGGKILMLPDELLHKVFSWLPVDTYATLSLVSPHWKAFTRTEAVYRRLCERLYLNQSKRRALHVHRFNNSYHTMLERRPRVRAGGGVYVMKYSQVKAIQRDMWTEVRSSSILRVKKAGVGGCESCVSLFRHPPFGRFLWVPFSKWSTTGISTFRKTAASCTP